MGKRGGDWIVEAVKQGGGSGEELDLMTVCDTGSLATSVSPLLLTQDKGADTDHIIVLRAWLWNCTRRHNLLVRGWKVEQSAFHSVDATPPRFPVRS